MSRPPSSLIILIIGLLTLYMGYLVFLEPLTAKWRQNSYRQQKEEEVRGPAVLAVSSGDILSSPPDLHWPWLWTIFRWCCRKERSAPRVTTSPRCPAGTTSRWWPPGGGAWAGPRPCRGLGVSRTGGRDKWVGWMMTADWWSTLNYTQVQEQRTRIYDQHTMLNWLSSSVRDFLIKGLVWYIY